MDLITRLRNLAGSARVLAHLDSDARRALGLVAEWVAKENVRPREAPGIHPTAMISPFASLRFTERVEIGPRALLHPYSFVWGGWSRAWARVAEGANIGMGATILAGQHDASSPVENMRYTDMGEADVTVGRGAGIGANVVVVGCRVGAGALVTANSVVTRDIPDLAIAVGAPARVVAYRPEPETSGLERRGGRGASEASDEASRDRPKNPR